MKNNIFKTKATTIFAYVQYLGGLAVLFLLVYKTVPEQNEDLIKLLATALIVSTVKDSGQWMYNEVKERYFPQSYDDNYCSKCNRPMNHNNQNQEP